LSAHSHTFHKVVDFDPERERLYHFDFSDANKELDNIDFADTEIFTSYIKEKLKKGKAKFGIGGYNENRILYKHSNLFSASSGIDSVSAEEDRTLHLGIDIWGEAGTKVYAPIGGMVHSFAFNNNPGDYGATIILSHQLEGTSFYTLFGHLSLNDITSLPEGYYISRGQEFAHFGNEKENGYWPPHLHFQLISDIGVYGGDYPGVCKYSERQKFLSNSPDPDVILRLMQYV
jgi:murein DD-endopeptidase MepM/ murein hydrolase activator NlpD